MMGTGNKLVEEYRAIKAEYAFSADVFNDEPARVHKLKYIVDRKLSAVDKTIILLYADCLSLRKLAKAMGVSHTTIGNEVKRIKKLILDEYSKL